MKARVSLHYKSYNIIEELKAKLKKIKIDREKVIIKVKQKDITEVYDIGDKIGQGGYGKVYKAIHKESGLTRAIKKIKKKNLDQAN
jgi:calcium-dependent protein kinase